MGKTANRPRTTSREPKPVARKRPAARARRVKMAGDQQHGYEHVREWIRRRLKEGERMPPAERAKADAEWELFRTSMNEERARVGARLLYVEPTDHA